MICHPRYLLLAMLTPPLLTGCATGRATPSSDKHDERGFITLFDGKSMDGWDMFTEQGGPSKPDAFYIDDEGNCVCKAYNYYWWRYKARQFDNFVLRLDFKVTNKTNSGVCMRTLDNGVPPPFTGFEVQILDDYGQKPSVHTTGAIYDIVTPMYNASKPAGQWNELEITCDGHLVTVILNGMGMKVIDTDFGKLTEPIGKFSFAYADLPKTGYIAFQDHGYPVWFRNIRIKPL
jgi:hypothetical protein